MLSAVRFVIGAALAMAVLGLTAVGLVTATRLAGPSKVGPIESSRSLPFDDGAHWNQFYHPDGARHFEVIARKREIAASFIEPTESRPLGEVPSLAVAAPPDRASESVAQAVAQPALRIETVTPAMTSGEAVDQRVRVLALQDDPRDRSMQATWAQDQRRHEPPPQPPLKPEALAAGAAAQPLITVVVDDRFAPPAVEAAPGKTVDVVAQPAAPPTEQDARAAESARDHTPTTTSKGIAPTTDTVIAPIPTTLTPEAANSESPTAALPTAAEPASAPAVTEPKRPPLTDARPVTELPVADTENGPEDGNALTGSAAGEAAIETGAVPVAPAAPPSSPASGTAEGEAAVMEPKGPALETQPAPAAVAPAPATNPGPPKLRDGATVKAKTSPAGKRARSAAPKPAPPARVAARPAPRPRSAAPIRRQAPYDPYAAQQQFTQPNPVQQYQYQDFPAQRSAPRPAGRRQAPNDPFYQPY